MYAMGGVGDVLAVIAGALLVMVVVLTLFGVETNQLSLEEIAVQDNQLSNSNKNLQYHDPN